MGADSRDHWRGTDGDPALLAGGSDEDAPQHLWPVVAMRNGRVREARDGNGRPGLVEDSAAGGNLRGRRGDQRGRRGEAKQTRAGDVGVAQAPPCVEDRDAIVNALEDRDNVWCEHGYETPSTDGTCRAYPASPRTA